MKAEKRYPFYRFTISLLLISLPLFLLLSCSSTIKAADGNSSLETFTEHLNSIIPKLMKRYQVPGVNIALIQEGRLVWSEAYGYADLAKNREMQTGTICRVESISKSVTAWGVLKLVEEGIIDLDIPIQNYLVNWNLPVSDYPLENITTRMLLSHSSGMPLGTIGEEYPPEASIPSLRENLSREAIAVKQASAAFIYSNVGFNILEALIEETTNRDFSEFMAKEILMPLGMKNSSFSWKKEYKDNLPTGYDLKGKPVTAYVYPAKASGSLFSTVEDIALFVAAGMTESYFNNPGILGRKSLHSLYSVEKQDPGIYSIVADAYGFGHFLETLSNGETAAWHGGQGHGWMSHFHIFPETGAGIVILTNSQRSWPLMARILKQWSIWNQVKPVKMSRISYGVDALWALSVLMILFLLVWLYRFLRDIRINKRKFSFLLKNFHLPVFLQFIAGIIIIAVLIWCAFQPYLLVTSVFPGVSSWAGIVFLLFGVILSLTALFPKIKTY